MPDQPLVAQPAAGAPTASVAHQLAAQRARRPATPLVSLVVPVFNEEDAVDPFVAATSAELTKAGVGWEMVFVNDGSRDETLARLLDHSARDKRVRVVNLSRNFGKEAALTAGIDHAKGDVLIPMDIDLQDPPELIGPFLEKWREGYDVVYGVRTARESDTAAKRMSAGWFYRVFNVLSPVQIPANAGDFRLVDRRAVEILRRLPERNRFMKGLFAWVGFNAVGVPYERPARTVGSTKFNFWGLWNFALDGVVSFSTTPLRAWFYVGMVLAGMSFLYAIFIIGRVLLFGIDTPGYASLLSAVLFMGGIQLLTLGIIGEYLGRLFVEVKGRPIYVVESVYEEGAPRPSPTAPEK
jgi:glycosyltransferase involved in cell wall biosynthesis